MKRIYKNVTVLDGTKNMKIQENMMLVVEDGKIVSIERNNAELSGENVVDLKGKYLMPGLINLHVHIPATGYPKKKEGDNKKLAKLVMATRFTQNLAQKFLCNPSAKMELLSGCTTIRAVGGVGHIDSRMRDQINEGIIDGPRVVACDYALTVPGGHMEGTVAIGVDKDEDFISLISENAATGADWIKIMITGGVLDATVPGEPGEMKMNAHQVKVCCDKAHQLGLKVCAHVESPMGIKVALENGVDSIEHGASVDAETVQLFKEKGSCLVCTISPAVPLSKFPQEISGANDVVKYNTEVLFDGILEATRKCLDAGVTVGLGTDTGCPFVTHYDMWRELEYLHKLVNVDRKECLHIATQVNAEILGLGKETGTIEVGKSADFIVSDKNPLEGFDALRNLERVVLRGKEYIQPVIKKNEACETNLDAYLASLN